MVDLLLCHLIIEHVFVNVIVVLIQIKSRVEISMWMLDNLELYLKMCSFLNIVFCVLKILIILFYYCWLYVECITNLKFAVSIKFIVILQSFIKTT